MSWNFEGFILLTVLHHVCKISADLLPELLIQHPELELLSGNLLPYNNNNNQITKELLMRNYHDDNTIAVILTDSILEPNDCKSMQSLYGLENIAEKDAQIEEQQRIQQVRQVLEEKGKQQAEIQQDVREETEHPEQLIQKQQGLEATQTEQQLQKIQEPEFLQKIKQQIHSGSQEKSQEQMQEKQQQHQQQPVKIQNLEGEQQNEPVKKEEPQLEKEENQQPEENLEQQEQQEETVETQQELKQQNERQADQLQQQQQHIQKQQSSKDEQPVLQSENQQMEDQQQQIQKIQNIEQLSHLQHHREDLKADLQQQTNKFHQKHDEQQKLQILKSFQKKLQLEQHQNEGEEEKEDEARSKEEEHDEKEQKQQAQQKKLFNLEKQQGEQQHYLNEPEEQELKQQKQEKSQQQGPEEQQLTVEKEVILQQHLLTKENQQQIQNLSIEEKQQFPQEQRTHELQLPVDEEREKQHAVHQQLKPQQLPQHGAVQLETAEQIVDQLQKQQLQEDNKQQQQLFLLKKQPQPIKEKHQDIQQQMQQRIQKQLPLLDEEDEQQLSLDKEDEEQLSLDKEDEQRILLDIEQDKQLQQILLDTNQQLQLQQFPQHIEQQFGESQLQLQHSSQEFKEQQIEVQQQQENSQQQQQGPQIPQVQRTTQLPVEGKQLKTEPFEDKQQHLLLQQFSPHVGQKLEKPVELQRPQKTHVLSEQQEEEQRLIQIKQPQQRLQQRKAKRQKKRQLIKQQQHEATTKQQQQQKAQPVKQQQPKAQPITTPKPKLSQQQQQKQSNFIADIDQVVADTRKINIRTTEMRYTKPTTILNNSKNYKISGNNKNATNNISDLTRKSRNVSVNNDTTTPHSSNISTLANYHSGHNNSLTQLKFQQPSFFNPFDQLTNSLQEYNILFYAERHTTFQLHTALQQDSSRLFHQVVSNTLGTAFGVNKASNNGGAVPTTRIEEVQLYNALSLRKSRFNPFNPTRILIHGWMGGSHATFYNTILPEYLKLHGGTYNVFTVDWGRGALADYITASYRVKPVGKVVAKFIDFIHRESGAHFSDIHLIGFSMGAHVAGIAGKFVQTGRIPVIYALDPALPLFRYESVDERIAIGDADYIEVIHTSAGSYGYDRPLGHVDFYINYGSSQPGCFLYECHHFRAFQVFAESLQTKGTLRGEGCDTQLWQDMIKNRRCLRGTSKYLTLGGDPQGREELKQRRGVYYVTTNSNPPYGRVKRSLGGPMGRVRNGGKIV